MSKSIISKTSDLKKTRKKYKRRNRVWSVINVLVVMLIWFAYTFLITAYHGNWNENGKVGMEFLQEFTWIAKLPYPEIVGSLFDFELMSSIIRLSIAAGAFVVGILLALLLSHFRAKRYNKKYMTKYKDLLVDEIKLNGLTIAKVTDLNEVNYKAATTLSNLDQCSKGETWRLSSSSLSCEISQYEYTYKDKKRPGVLICTDVFNGTSNGFISVRSYGKPSIKEYDGKSIEKFGLSNEESLKQFVIFSTLGQEIYEIVDTRLQKAIADFQHYVTTNVAVTIVGTKIYLFVDGWTLKLIQSIKKNVSKDVLERQAEAIMGLHSVVSRIAISVASRVEIDSKGNGII